MWTSERRREAPVREAPAELGTVTLGGDPAGVSLGGERRWLTVYSPGGYCWRPGSGEKVLVLKAGAEGESPCVLGTVQKEVELNPGEVKLTGGESSVLLGRDELALAYQGSAVRLSQSRTELAGPVYVNGQELKEYIIQIVMELLG